jgi:serine/threonine-protein kinase RsbW
MSVHNGHGPDVVRLSIPCRAEYVGVARLAILGVASRLNFSYDEVEDLRLAVGEACAGAIDGASPAAQQNASINIECEVASNELAVLVNYNLAPFGAPPETAPVAEQDIPADLEGIGSLLMEILVDSVETTNDPDSGTSVRLTKKVQQI